MLGILGGLDHRLDVLDPTGAVSLLNRFSSRVGSFAARVATLCGNLPLALKLASGFIQQNTTMAVAELVNQIATQRKGLDETEATFEASWVHLPANLQLRCAKAAELVGSWDAEAAAAIWQTSLQEAKADLQILINNHCFVEFAADRYRMHDLIAEFCARKLPYDFVRPVCNIHAEHFAKILGNISSLDKGIQPALTLFDVNWGNIWKGHYWCATQRPMMDKVLLQPG